MKMNDDQLRRICSWPDIDGELRLLKEAGLVDLVPPDYDESAYWRIYIRGGRKSEHFGMECITFIDERKLNHYKIFRDLDFSDF
jgi:hypothetical protein